MFQNSISDIKPYPRPRVAPRRPLIIEEEPPRALEPAPENKNFSASAPPSDPIMFLEKFKRFILIAILAFLLAGGLVFIGARVAFSEKQALLEKSEHGFRNLALAVDSIREERFDQSLQYFNQAHQAFSDGAGRFSGLAGTLIDMARFVPGFSKLSSGKYAFEAGEHFSLAGLSLAEVVRELELSKDAYAQGDKISWLQFLARIEDKLKNASLELASGNAALEKINLNDIPEDKREAFLSARRNVPTLIGLFGKFEQYRTLWRELLGGNGPRKYLFLLQNNHELRATGGFIGSYALLDVNDGVVRNFFVDGIFNPDGQLKENIVPPKPLQKISAAWSLHDSNWFPDFPKSAEKAIFFYEKTGGPTVDGVITLTPTIMQKLLAATGPITLPQYGLTVDAENFMPVIQEQVEVKYDRQENQPKKVLQDLSVLLFEKIFAAQDESNLYKIAGALLEGLNEKQMLLYARNEEVEKLIDQAGWSGKILSSSGDYLSVIHTNINGYKTDGVIDENIKHKAEIGEDGSIVDTVTITRVHHGGQTPYDWWNRVNADYLRVYVPPGSKLLSAKGATWEFPEAPLDYQGLGFARDAEVAREENSVTIDDKSGTRVYEDAGKTVFGAWVYVSPQESVTVEYRYLLPVTLDMEKIKKGDADSYSVIYQKQSGSSGSALVSSVVFPETTRLIWQSGGNLLSSQREWRMETDLKTDVFAGMVLGEKE